MEPPLITNDAIVLGLLVAVIGTRMDVFQIADQPILFLVGIIWMLFHVTLLIVIAKLVRAPFFFVAVGSKANVGGAASAPVLAGIVVSAQVRPGIAQPVSVGVGIRGVQRKLMSPGDPGTA